MNYILRDLAEVCQEKPLLQKIIITATYSDGKEISSALARKIGGFLNLKTQTFTGLANEKLADGLHKDGVKHINRNQGLLLLEEIILETAKQKKLQYFTEVREIPGIIPAIAKSIIELRECGLNADSLEVDSFIDIKKGHDIRLILKTYENRLEDHRLQDHPGLLKLFILWVSENPAFLRDKLFISFSFEDISPLEKKVIEVLSARVLPGKINSGSSSGLAKSGDKGRQIGDLGQEFLCAEDIKVPFKNSRGFSADSEVPQFYCAYGMYNEAQEILRRIYKKGISLDKAVVAFSNPEYVNVFRHLSRQMGFAITAATGYPVALTNPGKAVLMLLEWFTDNFSLKSLKPLLLEGCVQIEVQNDNIRLYPAKLLDLLREASVGKGPAEYIGLKEKSLGYQESAAELPLEDARRETILEKQMLFDEAYEFFKNILEKFPVIDGNGEIEFPQLVSVLLGALNIMAVVKNEEDSEALASIAKAFSDISSIPTRTYTIEYAQKKFYDIIATLFVGASSSQPGALHLASYHQLAYLNREYTFIAGLDSQSFPGHAVQDPILLDKERSQISPGLKMQGSVSQRKENLMWVNLLSREGEIFLSYSCHDPQAGKSNYPSPMLLQVLRLKKGDASLDYSDLYQELGPAIGYGNSGEELICLNELEWWLTKIMVNQIGNLENVLKGHYPGLQKGLKAFQIRSQPAITEYDGQILVYPQELDPRVNKKITVSSSRLEMIAKCPYRYFLVSVLGVRPPEENIPDQYKWLDPLQRGSLLHQLYQRFMSYIISRNEKVSYELHLQLIEKMAWELIVAYRKILTPPTETVYRHEVRQILSCAKIFLKCEEENPATPVCLEAPFGLGAKAVKEAVGGCPEPLTIVLPGDYKLQIKGIIDRIDHLQDDYYAVWDYKTGSTYGYSGQGYFAQGKQIQHALYALAAEQILKRQGIKDPQICVSGYYFVADKGEGQRFGRSQGEPEKLYKVITLLCKLMARGQFLATANSEECNFCEYQNVCDYQLATAKIAALLENPDFEELELRRELISIE